MALAMELGQLTREADLRKVWPNEAKDFTPWLANNIDLLCEILDLNIAIEGQEGDVGPFSVDLYGKATQSGREVVVVIENQFGPSDHDHLGKLLTYAAGRGAGVAIWVASTIRDPHRKAVDWLNGRSDEVWFFAVEVELLQIDNSKLAPQFRVVARPSALQTSLAPPSKLSLAYQAFFSDFVRRAQEAHPGFSNKNPDRVRYDNWTTFGAGRAGFTIEVAFAAGGRFRVAISMNTGDRDRNLAAFEQLLAERKDIEGELGQELEWERLDDWVQCRIGAYRDGGVESPDVVLDEHKKWAVDLVPKFRDAFGPRIQKLDLDAMTDEAATNEEATP